MSLGVNHTCLPVGVSLGVNHTFLEILDYHTVYLHTKCFAKSVSFVTVEEYSLGVCLCSFFKFNT